MPETAPPPSTQLLYCYGDKEQVSKIKFNRTLKTDKTSRVLAFESETSDIWWRSFDYNKGHLYLGSLVNILRFY